MKYYANCHWKAYFVQNGDEGGWADDDELGILGWVPARGKTL
jgi:hypothetical protein